MFLPYYHLTEGVGFSGNDKRWPEISIYWFTRNANPDYWKDRRFNPYRDLFAFGTTLGFRGKNYYFSDNTLVGILLRLIF